MDYRALEVRSDGPVEYLTLNRPEVRNAFNDELIAELTQWAAGARVRRDLRAVVLAGAGPTFCAGADVAWMAKTVERTEAENLHDATAMAHMFADLDDLPFALIGCVRGAALGGGAGLAAVCDIVVAEATAVFGFTEVKLGILPAVISPFVIAKIGQSAARELFLTGARFSAARAYDIGLVHAVVQDDELDRRVASYLRDLLNAAPEAVAAAKALISKVPGMSQEQAISITAQTIAERRVSPEGQEGLRAFLDKRPPVWGLDAVAVKDANRTKG